MKRINGVLVKVMISPPETQTGLVILVGTREKIFYANASRIIRAIKGEVYHKGDKIYIDVDGDQLYNIGHDEW